MIPPGTVRKNIFMPSEGKGVSSVMTSSFENWSGLQAASAGFPGKKLLQGCLVLPNYHLKII